MNRYENLVSPLIIGHNIIKNRTIYPNACPHVLQGPETWPSEPFRAFYAGLAKNGAAIVTIAEWDDPNQHTPPPFLDPDMAADMDMVHMQSFNLKDPSTHNYFSQMAEEIHFFGSKLLLEVNVELPDGYTLSGGPMPGPHPPKGGDPKPLPVEMIPQVIEKFLKKVRVYKNIGYDGISMRVDAYLTPSEYHRDDEYAGDGSVADRTRFVRELLAAVKARFGQDFLVETISMGWTPMGYSGNSKVGYPVEDTIAYLKLCEETNCCDIFQIRDRDACLVHASGYTHKKGVHENIEVSAQIKAAGVKMPLAVVGGYNNPNELEQYLREGKCDLFAMARAFIVDDEFGKKVYEGRGEDVRPCLMCNKCHGVHLPEPAPWTNVCSVNPEFGLIHKKKRLVQPVEALKKVAVIGGGPAGMQAAITSAERGHRVTLYERTDVLGGQLLHADTFSFKWPIHEYRLWLIRRLGQLGIDVRMNAAPTPDEIRAGGYDVVFAATGAKAVRPGIPGAESCPTCKDVYLGNASLGKNVVIVGASETGIETAMHLCENGHNVTLLTRQNELAHDASKLHYITMAWVKPLPGGGGVESPAWERYENLKGILEVTTTEIDGGTVTYMDKNGDSHKIIADSVVICGGVKANFDSAVSFVGTADRFFAVGDCNKVGNIQKCTREAYAAASTI